MRQFYAVTYKLTTQAKAFVRAGSKKEATQMVLRNLKDDCRHNGWRFIDLNIISTEGEFNEAS